MDALSGIANKATQIGTLGLSGSDPWGGGNPSYTGQDTGTPNMPGFNSIFASGNPDASTGGGVLSQYVLKGQPDVGFKGYMDQENSQLGKIPSLNTNPLSDLESFAKSGSNNPWVQAQMEAERQNEGQAMGAAQSGARAANTSAEDAMAARGGLNTGAMENLARNAGNNSTMAGQGVIGQGLQQRGQIQTNNAQNELGVAENLPGQEVQALQPALQEQSLWQQAAAQNQGQEQALDLANRNYNTGVNQWNITNQENGLNSQNQFNMTNYQNQIAKQAGQEQANAQSKSGKK